MYCNNCGKETNQGAKFCEHCGAPIQGENNPASVIQSYQQPPKPKKKQPLYLNGWFLFAVFGTLILGIFIAAFILKATTPAKTTELNNNNYSVEEQIEDNEEEETPVKFEKGQIYKEHKCKISVTGGENDTIKFYIENNSKKDYNFYIHSCSINGIMTDCNTFTMDTDIPAKKKANAELDLSSWIDDDTGTIEYVDVLFWAYNDLMKSYDTGILRIKTDAFSKERKSFDEGEPKKEFNKLSVSYCGEEDNRLYFAVVNNNNYMVDYNLDNCSINGWAFDTDIQVYDREIYPNSKDYFAIEVDDDFIEKNSIKKFKNIEFNLEVSPYGDVFKQFNTKKFKLKLS